MAFCYAHPFLVAEKDPMLRTSSLCLLVSLLFPHFSLAAPPATTGYDEATRIQQVRQQVEVLASKDARPADLRQGIDMLEAELAWLGRPQSRELGVGNDFLYGRGHDVRYDLARLYTRLGEKDKALDSLEGMQRFAWIPNAAFQLETSDAFASLRGEPRFAAILARGRIAERIWTGPAADVPYGERLSVEQRIAGLTQFWSEARASFVHFDHVPDLDWNRVYLDFLPKVMAAETTEDYYRVMMGLAPLLQDGHTNIYPPEQLLDRFFARPPVVTELVEDRVLVRRVDSASLAAQVRAGDELVAIDGVPVRRHAEEGVAPFVSSSTPQDKLVRMYGYQLLAGDARTPLVLTLRDAKGRVRDVRLARSGYQDLRQPERFGFRMLPGGVAYFALDHFEDDAGVKAFVAALPRILGARALVIDLRNNGGGSTGFSWDILGYLSTAPIPQPPQYVRSDAPHQRAQGDAVFWMPTNRFGAPGLAQAQPRVFDGKVAVLTGARTFSAGEDFVLAFNALKRGITVGAATGGSTGQPLFMKLPGGGSARVCVKRDLTADGRDFVGKGILPDVEVHESVDTVRANRDVVLERALALLKQSN